LQTHAPAAGEAVHRLIQLRHAETQAQNQRLRPRRCIMLTGIIQRGVGVAMRM
jgi:hypothetical protein